MRSRFVALVALSLSAAASTPAAAQMMSYGSSSRTSVGLSYDWSTPMGDHKDFVNNDSWLGFTIDVRKSGGPDNRGAAGLTIGYYEFYKMDGGASTQTIGNTTVTGQQYRHTFVIPMMLNVTGYAGRSSGARPYFGLNAGASYVKQTVDVGIYTLTSDALVVSAMPELGLMLPSMGRTAMNVHVRYHIPFGSSNLYAAGGSGASMQYLSVGVGFGGKP